MAGIKKIEDIVPDTARQAEIALRYPVQLADRRVNTITMRRPTLGDLLDYEPKSQEDVAAEVTLLGKLCSMRQEEMRNLDSTDYARLQEQYLRFRAIPGQEASAHSGDSPVPADALGSEGR